MSERSSEIPGFYKLSIDERRKKVAEFAGLQVEEMQVLTEGKGVQEELLGRMIENVVGSLQMPMGIATNFHINGKDRLVPMCIEEPSVVAAASNAAKLARKGGGFSSKVQRTQMIGQIQLLDIDDPYAAAHRILEEEERLLKMANDRDPVLTKIGGGARWLETRVVDTERGPMLIVHVIVDVRDAMGANAVNTMAETMAPELARLSGGRRHLRIISNLAIYRIARSRAVFVKEGLSFDDWSGEQVVDGILDAYAMAAHDPFRCATHNKGIMNGVSAVAIATGNDFRALEAGAHSYAAWRAKNGGVISPLTTYEKDSNGNLVGSIEMPMAVGTVGGATTTHPAAKLAMKILGVKGAEELACVMAAVGLAQNFAALRALATEGIQKGHMALHARNVAVAVGARGSDVDTVAAEMVKSGIVRQDKAMEILKRLHPTASA